MTQVISIVTSSLVMFAAIMLFYHHHIRHRVASKHIKALALGAMLGVGGSILILQPLDLGSDVTFSNRPMFVGFAGLLGGWIAAVTALVFTSITQLAIAGPDLQTKILVLCAAAAFGILGHIVIEKSRLNRSFMWGAVGGSLCLFVAVFWISVLPDSMRMPSLNSTYAVLTIASVVCGAVASGFIHLHLRNVVDQRQRAISASRKDELTQVLNRRGLKLEYESFLSEKQDTGIALATLDLDRFKQVNDSFGHTVGDRLLRLVADRIGHFVRKSDLVARTGGDEFVVVLTNIKQEKAVDTAERLCSALAEIQVSETDPDLKAAHAMITVSIGVAFVPKPPENIEALLEASDKLLYVAKKDGGGNVIVRDVEL
ncbi:GGDEF domain-containing protein [Roseicyclus marinus]|uniref:GGDEF domain-containing protein n=1 Tax=Roseicyclus marinus TaxID=2161673 RepID=UPI00240F2CD5|nr:GGDEF domain-containing protein [Roseicyclus marinus]MDG3042499.1 GGDEF domain-containing protein [Roseicyclus marinus]